MNALLTITRSISSLRSLSPNSVRVQYVLNTWIMCMWPKTDRDTQVLLKCVASETRTEELKCQLRRVASVFSEVGTQEAV